MYAGSDIGSGYTEAVSSAYLKQVGMRLQRKGKFEDLRSIWEDLPDVGIAQNVCDLFCQYGQIHGELTAGELNELLLKLRCYEMIDFTRQQQNGELSLSMKVMTYHVIKFMVGTGVAPLDTSLLAE